MSFHPPAAKSVDWRRVGNVAGLVVLLAVVGLFVVVAVPQAVGADHSYVVQSDSMAPAIPAGSVVFVGETAPAKLSDGDVVTYRNDDGQRVTHRIVEVITSSGDRRFRTKGDANEDADPSAVAAGAIVGRVSFHIPYIGYIVAFAGTRLGLVAMVIVPALVLAITELWDLSKALWTENDDATDASRSE